MYVLLLLLLLNFLLLLLAFWKYYILKLVRLGILGYMYISSYFYVEHVHIIYFIYIYIYIEFVVRMMMLAIGVNRPGTYLYGMVHCIIHFPQLSTLYIVSLSHSLTFSHSYHLHYPSPIHLS